MRDAQIAGFATRHIGLHACDLKQSTDLKEANDHLWLTRNPKRLCACASVRYRAYIYFVHLHQTRSRHAG
jgi:hypothetical protein